MGPRAWLAIAQWKPAVEGASWAAIDHAWKVLIALIDAACDQDTLDLLESAS